MSLFGTSGERIFTDPTTREDLQALRQGEDPQTPTNGQQKDVEGEFEIYLFPSVVLRMSKRD